MREIFFWWVSLCSHIGKHSHSNQSHWFGLAEQFRGKRVSVRKWKTNSKKKESMFKTGESLMCSFSGLRPPRRAWSMCGILSFAKRKILKFIWWKWAKMRRCRRGGPMENAEIHEKCGKNFMNFPFGFCYLFKCEKKFPFASCSFGYGRWRHRKMGRRRCRLAFSVSLP